MRSWQAISYGRPAPWRTVPRWLTPGIREHPVIKFGFRFLKGRLSNQKENLVKKQVIRTILLPGTLMLMGSMAPALAQLPVGGLELPPNYNTFQPPAVGGTYADPVFGSTVKRISNALGTPNADSGGYLTWIEDEYSTMSPFNSDNSKILLVHQSYFGLYDGTGFY